MSVSAISNSANSAAQVAVSQAAQQAKSQASVSNSSSNSSSSSSSTDSVEFSEAGAEASSHSSSVASLDDEVEGAEGAKGTEEEKEETEVTVNGTDGDDSIEVTINKDGSYTVRVNDGEEVNYTAAEAENLIIDGGNGNDTISIHQEGVKTIGDLIINGGDGDDTIVADENVRHALEIDGGRGDDTITGGKGDDIITDNYGNNHLNGGAGNDTITAMGEDYDDSLWGSVKRFFGKGEERPHNVIDGGDGNDIVYAGNGDDTIYGGDGRDYIEGGHGDDVIFGQEGGDVIYGGEGNDRIYGGDGDDFVNAGNGDDTVYGNAGNDTIFGLDGNDKLHGGAGDDTIAAGDGHDTVSGGTGNDTIRVTHSLFKGTDEVTDLEDGDDYKVLNTIDVPDNFQIADGQSQRFSERIQDDLEAFASIEPGQEMLTQYAATGHNMYYKEIDDQNCYAAPVDSTKSRAEIIENDDGTRTVNINEGTDSYIKINPAFIQLSGNQEWSEANSMVLVAHEMSHAYNNAMGNMDYSFYNNETGERMELPEGATSQDGWKQRAIRGAEWQAVGIFDNETISANPYGISENDYRAYFHMSLRDSYMSQNATQQAESDAAGRAIPEEYREYNEAYRAAHES